MLLRLSSRMSRGEEHFLAKRRYEIGGMGDGRGGEWVKREGREKEGGEREGWGAWGYSEGRGIRWGGRAAVTTLTFPRQSGQAVNDISYASKKMENPSPRWSRQRHRAPPRGRASQTRGERSSRFSAAASSPQTSAARTCCRRHQCAGGRVDVGFQQPVRGILRGAELPSK